MPRKPKGRVPKCVCGGTRGMGFLACKPCWQHVPLDMRRGFNRRDYGSPERTAKAREILRWLKRNPRPVVITGALHGLALRMDPRP